MYLEWDKQFKYINRGGATCCGILTQVQKFPIRSWEDPKIPIFCENDEQQFWEALMWRQSKNPLICVWQTLTKPLMLHTLSWKPATEGGDHVCFGPEGIKEIKEVAWRSASHLSWHLCCHRTFCLILLLFCSTHKSHISPVSAPPPAPAHRLFLFVVVPSPQLFVWHQLQRSPSVGGRSPALLFASPSSSCFPNAVMKPQRAICSHQEVGDWCAAWITAARMTHRRPQRECVFGCCLRNTSLAPSSHPVEGKGGLEVWGQRKTSSAVYWALWGEKNTVRWVTNTKRRSSLCRNSAKRQEGLCWESFQKNVWSLHFSVLFNNFQSELI